MALRTQSARATQPTCKKKTIDAASDTVCYPYICVFITDSTFNI